MKIYLVSDLHGKNVLNEYILNFIYNLEENNVEICKLNYSTNRNYTNGITFRSFNDIYKYICTLNNEIIFVTIREVINNIKKLVITEDSIFYKNKIYFFNSEPYLPDKLCRDTLLIKKNITIINYYMGNKKTIDRIVRKISTNKSLFIPQLYSDKDNINKFINEEKCYDIGFIFRPGKNNRRSKIVNQTKRITNNYIIINKWNDERDRLASKCKIIINLRNCDIIKDNRESLRIDRLINNKVIVVSEDIIYNKSQYTDKFIIYVKYDDIINKAKDILDNYDKYYSDIYSNYDINKLKQETADYINTFIKHAFP